ncbi:MAG: cupin domain-containing protein [Bacteroidales bacterium]|nr:cupin domain-containing protein [Bacteroidales bacterium]MCK4639296.1 cupin domain-containing protein [Bacteroidales bacterium]
MAKIIIEKLSESEIKKRGIKNWPIWEKEVSKFDWEYNGNEECLILDGEVTVETDEGNFKIKPGDFVTFKDGLKCVWDVKKNIRKHYNFK